MTGHGEKLSRLRDKAIAALLVHPSLAAAAKATGVHEKTLWRWLKDPAFAAAYREARAQAVSRAMGRLQQASEVAVTTLVQAMTDGDTPPAVKVAAAKMVLEMAFHGVALADVLHRLETLTRGHQPPPVAPMALRQNGNAGIH